MPELTPQQKSQLDNNIRGMLSQGASESDVMTYATDFRTKYDVEKKSKVGGVFPTESNSDGLVPLNGSANPFAYENLKPKEDKLIKPVPQSIEQGVKQDKKVDTGTVGYVFNSIVDGVAEIVGGIPDATNAVLDAGYDLIDKAFGTPGASKAMRKAGGVLAPPRLPEGQDVRDAIGETFKVSTSYTAPVFDVTNGVQASDVKSLAVQAPRQLLDMVYGAYTGGSSFFLQSVSQNQEELNKNPNAEKLSPTKKLGYIFTQGIVQAASDKIGLNQILKATGLSAKVQQKITNEIINEFKKKGIKATALQIEQAAFKKVTSLSSQIKRVGLKTATSFGVEGGTESFQQAASDGIKLLVGSDVFDTEDITTNFVKNVINAGVQGGAFGGVAGGGVGIMTSTKKAIRNELAKVQTPEDIQKIQADIAQQVEMGNITEAEANEANITAQQYAEIASKIPTEIDSEQKYALIGGIEQREGLKKEIEKVKAEMKSIDPAFHNEPSATIELLEAKLEQTNDYIEGIVTGKKPTYRKEITEEGKEPKFVKTDANGKETKITKEHYELAAAVREEEAVKNKEAEIAEEISKEEIKAARILGKTDMPDTLQIAAEQDPVGTLKEIAQQAQGIDKDGNPLNGGPAIEGLIGAGIPKTVIDQAVALYPAPSKDTTQNEYQSKYPKLSKPISEMSSDELTEHSREVKKYLKDIEVDMFGEEGAKKYREAQRILNNMTVSTSSDMYKEASVLVDKMEASLSPAQQKEFFGLGEQGEFYEPSELRDISTRVRLVEESENVSDLGGALKLPLLDFNSNPDNQGTLAVLNAAKKKAIELGIDPKEMLIAGLKRISKDLPDKTDAVDLAESIIKKLTKDTTQEGVGGDGALGDVDLSKAKLNFHVSKSPQGVQGEVRFGNGIHGKGFYTASEKSKVPFSGDSEQFLILTKKPFEENWRNNYRDKGVNDDMRTETLVSQGYDTIKTGDYEVAIGSQKQVIKIEKGTTYNDILKQATEYFGNDKDAIEYLKSKGIEQSQSPNQINVDKQGVGVGDVVQADLKNEVVGEGESEGVGLLGSHYGETEITEFSHEQQAEARKQRKGYTTEFGETYVFPKKGFFFFIGDAPPGHGKKTKKTGAYLDIKNPLDLTKKISPEDTAKIIDFFKTQINSKPSPGMAGSRISVGMLGGIKNAKTNGIEPQQLMDFISDNFYSNSKGKIFDDILKLLGKDGMIFEANSAGTALIERERGPGDGKTYKVAVALEPSQIKTVKPESTQQQTAPTSQRIKETKSADTGTPDKAGGETGEGKGAEPPISEPPKSGGVFSERPATELSHRGLQDVANEFSLPDVKERDTKTDIQLRQDARETVNDWSEKGQYAKNVERLAQKAEGVEVLTDKERVILEGHLANISAEGRAIRETKGINSPEYDAKLAEIQRLKDAGEKTRSEAGAALRIPTFNSRPQTIEDAMILEKDTAGVDQLTEKQKETVVKEYEDIEKAKQDFEAYMAKREEEFNAKQAEAAFIKAKATTKKTNKAHEDYVAERKSFKEELAAARKEHEEYLKEQGIQKAGFGSLTTKEAKVIAKIVRSYADEGITKLSEVVEKVFDEIKGVIPNIEKTDLIDVISGAYNEKKATRNQLAERMVNLRVEANLIKKLEALEKGEEPKSEQKKIQRNKELKELRDKVKGHDLTKLSQAKEKIKSQIEKVSGQIKTGDFSTPEKMLPVKLDAEGHKLRDNLMKLQQQRDVRMLLQQRQNESKKESALRNVAEVANVPRTLMTIADFSGLLRQNLFFTVGHPLMTSKALPGMFKSFTSQQVYDRWFADLKDSPRFEIIQDSKLAIADNLSHDLSKREEDFMSTLAEKIPIIGRTLNVGKVKIPGLNIVKGSERSYTMLLNKMRVDMFNNLATKLEDRGITFENSPKVYKATAEYINNATGRSDFGENLNRIAPILNSAFFSPRLIASRVNMLTYWAQPRFWKTLPKEARVDYFRNWISLLAVGGTILGIASLAGADTEDDPRSSDFGKIKSGNTRWDIWGGAQPYIRVLSQIISGERKSTRSGKMYELNGDDIFGETRGGVALDFFRNKLAPVPGAAVDILSGRTGIGDRLVYQWGDAGNKEISIDQYIKERLLPMTFTGTAEAMKDQGVKALFTVGVPSAFGVGTQTYGQPSPTTQKKTKPKRNTRTKPRKTTTQ